MLVEPPFTDPEIGRGTIELLAAAGVTVTPAGGRLRLSGDREVIEEVGDLLRQYAPAMRAALNRHPPLPVDW